MSETTERVCWQCGRGGFSMLAVGDGGSWEHVDGGCLRAANAALATATARAEDKTVRVRIVVNDDLPAAAAFMAGSTEDGAAEIEVNLAFHIACANIFGEPLPEVLASSLAHELMHVAQEIGKYGFTEEVVHASTDAAAAMQPHLTVVEPPTRDEAVAKLEAAVGAADSYRLERDQAWAEVDCMKAALATKDAEREAAVAAMREAAKAECEEEARSWDGAGRRAATCCAQRMAHLPTPTSALDAERERVVRETVKWCLRNPIDDYPDGDETAERYLARALAAVPETAPPSVPDALDRCECGHLLGYHTGPGSVGECVFSHECKCKEYRARVGRGT